MQNHWELGRWGRLPVTMDWTVLLAFPWLYLMMNDFLAAAIGSVAFFGLLVAHEYGHVLAARWRGVSVHGINFNGLHGETARGYARSQKDEVIIAWAGVGAQAVVLLLSWAAMELLAGVRSGALWLVLGPVLVVWTKWNVFLMIIALLPIGPMDGHAAWKLIPLLRQSFRRRPAPSPGKVVKLSSARKRAMEKDAADQAAKIIERLGKDKDRKH